jgi:hypothetical protein
VGFSFLYFVINLTPSLFPSLLSPHRWGEMGKRKREREMRTRTMVGMKMEAAFDGRPINDDIFGYGVYAENNNDDGEDERREKYTLFPWRL